MIKLKNEKKKNSIPVLKMKDGQVACITKWNCGNYVGRFVIRHNKALNALDPQATVRGQCWPEVFADHNATFFSDGRFEVELVEPGTVFEITVE
jgi:hypothetical protein